MRLWRGGGGPKCHKRGRRKDLGGPKHDLRGLDSKESVCVCVCVCVCVPRSLTVDRIERARLPALWIRKYYNCKHLRKQQRVACEAATPPPQPIGEARQRRETGMPSGSRREHSELSNRGDTQKTGSPDLTVHHTTFTGENLWFLDSPLVRGRVGVIQQRREHGRLEPFRGRVAVAHHEGLDGAAAAAPRLGDGHSLE